MGTADLELMQAPLDGEQLSTRWRAMLADRGLAQVEGKVELDVWGRIIVMSPVSLEHGGTAGKLSHLLIAQLGGRAAPEVGVLTTSGVLSPDVVWCSEEFWRARRDEAPLQVAPEICIEVASPSNTIEQLRGKVRAYLAAGAKEAWIVYPRSRRIEFHGATGELQSSSFQVDLSTLFD